MEFRITVHDTGEEKTRHFRHEDELAEWWERVASQWGECRIFCEATGADFVAEADGTLEELTY